jgi:MFS family permease
MVSLVLVFLALERFHSPALAGAVTFLSLAPGLFLSPIAGALLDRHGRTRLIFLDYLFAAACLSSIVVFGSTDLLSEVVLLVIVTVQSLTFPLSQTGVRTLFPLLVPKPLWERANAIDSNLYVISSILGPAAAGVLVASFGSLWALAVTAVMYLIAAAVTIGVHDPLGVVPHGRLLSDAWAGIVYVVRHPTLRGLATSVGAASIAHGLFYIGLPVLVLAHLGGNAAQVGQLFALQGVMAGISVLFFGRIGTLGRERPLMAASILTAGVGYLIAVAAPDLAVVALAMVVLGLGNGPFDIVLFTLRQRRTDPAWLGRAFAVSMSLNFIGFPVGSAFGGAIAPISLPVTFVAAFVLCVLGAILTFVTIPRE